MRFTLPFLWALSFLSSLRLVLLQQLADLQFKDRCAAVDYLDNVPFEPNQLTYSVVLPPPLTQIAFDITPNPDTDITYVLVVPGGQAETNALPLAVDQMSIDSAKSLCDQFSSGAFASDLQGVIYYTAPIDGNVTSNGVLNTRRLREELRAAAAIEEEEKCPTNSAVHRKLRQTTSKSTWVASLGPGK